MSVISASTPVRIVAPGSGGGSPTWFASLAEKTWTVIAKGTGTDFTSGATLASVNPNTVGINGTTGFASVIKAWCGAAANQTQKELMLVANGGHGDYWGNGVYALQLNRSIPRWFRLSDPSPASTFLTNPPCNVYGLSPAVYGDGRPAAMHTSNSVSHGNGKAYVMGQVAYSNIGGGNTSIFSFDRASLGADPSAPLAHNGGTGPWTYHGTSSLSSVYGFQCSTFDTLRNVAWGFCGISESESCLYYTINAAGTINSYNTGQFQSLNWQSAFAVYLPDVDRILINSQTSGKFSIINPANPGTVESFVTVSGFPTYPGAFAFGAFYHQPSQSILFYSKQFAGDGSIRKLKIPRSGNVISTNAAGWVLSTIAKAGGVNPSHEYGDDAGVYNKFNVIQDMGNGQGCIVLTTGLDNGFTYVYKLPVGEIF
jgi:hypothetical protein